MKFALSKVASNIVFRFEFILTAALATLFTGCLTQPAPYIPGSTVEHAERMSPVTDVPYTGDTEYIRAAQDYGLRNRRGFGYYGPYYGR